MKCSTRLKGERTTNAIYHLLVGKKSIQTVQDAYLYRLENFYGIYHQLDKKHFNETIQTLITQKYLFLNSETTCKPTDKGSNWLKSQRKGLQMISFNGLTYHGIDHVFLERLLLLIQVLTNKKMKHSVFIPITDKYPITSWMIVFYKRIKGDYNLYLTMIYEELKLLLHHFPSKVAELFVDRLTGYQHYGMSVYQLAEHYKVSVDDVRLLLTGITHQMLSVIRNNPVRYPFLTLVINDLREKKFLTGSALKTHNMIKSGSTAEQISRLRALKLNTIYDHIVEIALNDELFSIDPYVGKLDQREILDAINETGSFKLKAIKDKVHQDITYFQIRLVLTIIKGDKYEAP